MSGYRVEILIFYLLVFNLCLIIGKNYEIILLSR